MRSCAVRILAEQPRLDLDAGEAVALGDEARHLLVGQAGADRQRLEVLALVHQLLEALAVLASMSMSVARPSMVFSRSPRATA
jgi:hypothetical protein